MIGIKVADPYVPDTTPVVERDSVPEAPRVTADPDNTISPAVPFRAYVVIACVWDVPDTRLVDVDDNVPGVPKVIEPDEVISLKSIPDPAVIDVTVPR